MNSIQLIRASYPSLTGTEKRIADFILQSGEQVVHMSIGQLAAQVQAAKSAVIRFCKSVGFDGYAQLKLSLAADLAKNKKLNYTPYIYPQDSDALIMEKVFSANVKALHDTAAALDLAAAEAIMDMLQHAGCIYLYGIGTSAGMVTELQYRLMQLGYNAFAFTDPPTMKVSTMNIRPGDAALAISHSGRTIATLEAITLAGEVGANTACITSYPGSPITKVCKESLCVYSDEVQYPVEAMAAKIAQLSLIYALTTALSARNYEETAQRNKRSRELINTIRTGENQ